MQWSEIHGAYSLTSDAIRAYVIEAEKAKNGVCQGWRLLLRGDGNHTLQIAVQVGNGVEYYNVAI